MLEAIHHVQITVPTDALDAAIAFYRDVLGLPLTTRPPEIKSHGAWFRVFDRDLHLGVEDGIDRARTRAHVAFLTRDLDAMRTRLASAGIETKLPRHAFAGYDRVQFRDPWGNQVELIRPLGNLLDVDRRPMPKVHLSVACLHDDGRVLMVREAKPAMLNKWNLPGGHAERGEHVVPGALRELLEETGVDAQPTGLLGVFSTDYSVRIVLLARAADPMPIAGDEILESRFWTPAEALALDDAHFVNPPMMRAILVRIARGVSYSLDVIEAIG
jgi:ADP-ribose pyrophosphatase YjhB (NUDIX family)/predicted enzyme related to lactoylglutathione lyase